jgi:hypothetical protein
MRLVYFQIQKTTTLMADIDKKEFKTNAKKVNR